MHLALNLIQAGFPSPADDYADTNFDISKFLIDKPAATFFVRAQGESMTGAGIFSGDLLVVDKSKDPHSGDVVVAFVNGEFTIKRFFKKEGRVILQAANKNFKNITINSDEDFQIWGVVSFVIHNPNG